MIENANVWIFSQSIFPGKKFLLGTCSPLLKIMSKNFPKRLGKFQPGIQNWITIFFPKEVSFLISLPWHVESSPDNLLGIFTSNLRRSFAEFPKMKKKHVFQKPFSHGKFLWTQKKSSDNRGRKLEKFPHKKWNTTWKVFSQRKCFSIKTFLWTRSVQFWLRCQKNFAFNPEKIRWKPKMSLISYVFLKLCFPWKTFYCT